MKRLILIMTSVLAIAAQAQTPHDWENPHVLGINKLPYHATLQLPSKWKECKEIVSLDGQWQFHWSKDPESRPADFYREDFDVSQWDKIQVPGCWQLQCGVIRQFIDAKHMWILPVVGRLRLCCNGQH